MKTKLDVHHLYIPVLTHRSFPFQYTAVYNPRIVNLDTAKIVMFREVNRKSDNKLPVKRSNAGILLDDAPEPDGTLKINYSAADTCISLATASMMELFNSCLPLSAL